MSDHVRARKSAYLLLVNLSIWRLAGPLIGYWSFSITGLLVGLVMSLVFHLVVKDYVGFNLFTVKSITKKEDFIRLKRWMVAGNKKPLSAVGMKSIDLNATKYAKERLCNHSLITNYDYANACLFDEQFGKDKELEDDRLAASKTFYAKANQ